MAQPKPQPQSLEEKIEESLLAGQSRRQIIDRLKNEEDPQKLLFHANNISNPAVRGKYVYLNLLLAFFLLFVTSKKLLTIVQFGAIDLFFFLSLVPVVINFYLLREILRFRRIGYHFLLVLAPLSLLLPENRLYPELPMILAMTVLSGFLFFRMFPPGELIKTLEK
ncbi:hypothetical protein [Desulfurivibrio dismutans]|uniref:hypothetical protein n=1 Tax=Desulfurivibrio dismutans TaxID=1398908 RepID=UPI0023DB5123|nr:hypothetical protein [Desulfurivibrio alkaliphilus]MDF1614886.1 hypothetical protein [Desulfurivibrio alkaliphilus]